VRAPTDHEASSTSQSVFVVPDEMSTSSNGPITVFGCLKKTTVRVELRRVGGKVHPDADHRLRPGDRSADSQARAVRGVDRGIQSARGNEVAVDVGSQRRKIPEHAILAERRGAFDSGLTDSREFQC